MPGKGPDGGVVHPCVDAAKGDTLRGWPWGLSCVGDPPHCSRAVAEVDRRAGVRWAEERTEMPLCGGKPRRGPRVDT